MAFHRHTGKVDVLLGVVGEALCTQFLVNGEEGIANRLLHQENNTFECTLKPRRSAAITNDGKPVYNQCGGLVLAARWWWWFHLFCKMLWMVSACVSAAVGRLGLSCYLRKTR